MPNETTSRGSCAEHVYTYHPVTDMAAGSHDSVG